MTGTCERSVSHKIIRFTPEQQAMLPAYVERWTKIALSTEPADRPAAEAAIHEMYRCGELEPPKRIVWCDSPLAMARAAVDRGASDCLAREIGHGARIEVAKAIMQEVCVEVRADLLERLALRIHPDVRLYIQAEIDQSFKPWRQVTVHGQHAAGWLSFYAFFAEQCGLADDIAPLRGAWALAEAAGWAWPFRGVCFVCERQSAVYFDARRRLHRPDGPALTYPDGWSVYAWHGQAVAAEMIEERRELTPDDILAVENAEVRRLWTEIYEDLHGAGALSREIET